MFLTCVANNARTSILTIYEIYQGYKIRISHMPHYAPRALWATKISAQDAREGAHIMTQGRIQNFVLERARYIKIGKLNYLCQLITTKLHMTKASSLICFIFKVYKYSLSYKDV